VVVQKIHLGSGDSPNEGDSGVPEIERQYQDQKLIAALRERAVAPHVSEYKKCEANFGKNALNQHERTEPRSISERKRKLIEQASGREAGSSAATVAAPLPAEERS